MKLELKNKISSKLYSYEIEFLKDFKAVPVKYPKEPKTVDGRIIIRDNFESLLKTNDDLLIFGEDVGKIGDVNQGLEGLQKKIRKIKNL